MASKNNTVLIISGNSGNDAVNGIMRNIAQVVEQADLKTLFIDVSAATDPLYQTMVDLLENGAISFGLSYLGVGQDWTVNDPDGENTNLWDYFKVPLLKMHGDMPAYFLARHQNTPKCSANLYHADEFLNQNNWLLPQDNSPSFRYDPCIISDTEIDLIDFKQKKNGKLVFMKNGGNPEDLINLWRTKLPAPISKCLCELAETVTPLILQENQPSIHQAVLDHINIGKLNPDNLKQVIRLFTAQIDDYTRRIKSTQIAKALLNLPVIIQGSRWEHIDFSGATAKLAPPQNYAQSEEVFRTQLGVIDMTPNITTGSHDRIERSAGTHSFVLSNRTTWLENTCPQLNQRAYTFSIENIAQSATWAIENPEECIALGIELGKAYRKKYSNHRFIERLQLIADLIRIEKTDIELKLQPFFVR